MRFTLICIWLFRWTSAFLLPSNKVITHRYRQRAVAYNQSLSATQYTIRKVLDQLRDSEYIRKKHLEHCQAGGVTHLFKGTPLANASDIYKLKFVDSWAGRALETIMAEEQAYLGDWKMEKILEAAGDAFDSKKILNEIEQELSSSPIVMYSFVDCPWCVAAKALLQQEYSTVKTTIVELESLGLKGKAIRAELAQQTGRTSMPCIFVRGRPIGGFTDGTPCGAGLRKLSESGRLSEMLDGLT